MTQPHRLARSTDPASSHAAAERAARFARGHYAKILHAIDQAQRPLTINEIGIRAGLTGVQVARRLPTLREEGVVRSCGDRKCGLTGLTCQTWARVAEADEQEATAAAATGRLFADEGLPD